MPVELAEIAAGLPLAASFAMATGISTFREGRRRSSLNEAMHELRRPLQALALTLTAEPGGAEAAGSALRMAVAAIERLDREINGGGLETAAGPVAVRPVLAAATARWRPCAGAEGRSLRLLWKAGEPQLRGDEVDLAQAVDNLISNALRHGSGGVTVEASEAAGILRLAVRDGGTARAPRRPRRFARRVGAGRRHGYGLRVVRRTAARLGGSFRLSRSSAGTEARLELPLAGGLP